MPRMTQVVVWLNEAANSLGGPLLAWIGLIPGWLSATIVAAVTGVLMLLVFKYTSNQGAIKRVRNEIKANLLALSLFKDNLRVSVRAQGRILLAAMRLLLLAVVPMLVMTVPMCLLLGQLSLWYQLRPLEIGEEAVISVVLNGGGDALPRVTLRPNSAMKTAVGPVRILSQHTVCWNVLAREAGYHQLEFDVDGQAVFKELAIGNGFRRVSARRPSWDWSEVLLYPWEDPFPPQSVVQSITIDYPTRSSWTSGSDKWIGYWFVASMIAALGFRRVLKVNI